MHQKEKKNLPEDFDPYVYREMYPDLKDLNFYSLCDHYIFFGKQEGRIYKLNLPADFNVNIYRNKNPDLSNLSDKELAIHYSSFGYKEKREYSDKFFDELFFIQKNKITCLDIYKEYIRDVRQIKSQVVQNIINSVKKRKIDFILINHNNTINGATHSLYVMANELKKNNKVLILDVDKQPEEVYKKYNLKNTDFVYYFLDPTILYWMCNKIDAKKIIFNSTNQAMCQVVKWIPAHKLILFSREIKEHYVESMPLYPDFVITPLIAKSYKTKPKVQTPILPLFIQTIIDLNYTDNTDLLDLDPSKITIGMCGSIGIRKNTQLFLNVAEKLPNYNFIWIGGNENLQTSLQNVYHVKETIYPYKYYKLLDYFVLFSEHEPFGNVVLENFYIGNKVLTFRDNIYYNFKNQLTKNSYFEYPGKICIDSAVKHITNCAIAKKINTDYKNEDSHRYVVNNFSTYKKNLAKTLLSIRRNNMIASHLLKLLIYGQNAKLIAKSINENYIGVVSEGIEPGGNLKYAGICGFKGAVESSLAQFVIISYFSTNQLLESLELHECLDSMLLLSKQNACIPVLLIATSEDTSDKRLRYIKNLKTYASKNNLLIIDLAENNGSEIATHIYNKLAEYKISGDFKKIIYDAPLGKSFSDIQELTINQSATEVDIIGNGLICGFELNSDIKFNSTHVYHNKNRENDRHGKGVIFVNGGRFTNDYKLTLTASAEEQKIEIRKIFYKGKINDILLDNQSINFIPEQNMSKVGFVENKPRLVHETSENRYKVYNWCTSTLNKTEDCNLFKYDEKRVIVIFSSTDRPYLTDSKKQHLHSLAKEWKAELQIINDPFSVLSKDQIEEATSYTSRRPNILNYVCKILIVYNALNIYDRVIWLDDTNVISPFAPNLFNVVPNDSLGALVIPREAGLNDAPHDYRYLLKHRETCIDDIYYNTGVMVIPKIYRDIFSFESVSKDADLFQSPYPTQCWQNYLMKVHNCKVYDISCMYNMMPCCYHFERAYNEVTDLTHLYKEFLKYHIVHFTGFHKHREMLHMQFLKHSEDVFDQKITIVVMNFKRSSNIKDCILPYYDNILAVDQVILVHCYEPNVFEYDSPKVQHVYEYQMDKEYGVFTRYLAAKKYAKNRCVLFTDDDVVLPAKTLSMVYQKWKENPNRVIGAEGRRIYRDLATNQYQYKSVAYHGDVDFLLTSCCMSSIENIINACDQEPIMGNYKNTTIIKWNGEDMFLCLTASIFHDIKCYSVDSPVVSLDEGLHVISRVDSHIEERCRFLNIFFSHFLPVSTFEPIDIPIEVLTETPLEKNEK